VPGAVSGLVREVIVVDGGSSDETARIAEGCGADVLKTIACRGAQLALGAARARASWLLFLHADTVLETGWEHDVASYIERQELRDGPPLAAAFRFTLDDSGLAPRLVEAAVGLRAGLFGRPWGDQGLLIARSHLAEVGGVKPLPIMEDVDLVRRIGRRRLTVLRSRALTSASRFRAEGYLARIARNRLCLTLYAVGVPLERIARIYRGGQRSDPARVASYANAAE
jgi:glycosyltransferase involved in cell wall biosynthesis